MSMPKQYEPKRVEAEMYRRWEQARCFHAEPADPSNTYCIVIPPPNVTDRLHLGHALNNTLQDILIRHQRMRGRNTLWLPGSDHAGIATQTVVEKRILAEEGKRRTDFPRAEFVARVQAWKDEYEQHILSQLRAMGCSCDWERTRFTMDEVCARAVRTAFFRLFSEGLIYRGKRLVNWDPATQTVLADDEVEYETVHGHFWYLRYPLVEPVLVPGSAGVPPAASSESVPPARRPQNDLPPVGLDRESLQKRWGSYLPHWTQPEGTYSVCFRLADSLPSAILEEWRAERDEIPRRAEAQGRKLTQHERAELSRLHSERIERYLDAGHGECHLRDERVARVVAEALQHFDGDRYDLIAWCVMPNHVHAVIHTRGGSSLSDIVHSWKSFTAKKANEVLGRRGAFWQREYYDHIVRNLDDLAHSVEYVWRNPEQAGLENWPWRGLKPGCSELHGQDAHATGSPHGQDAHGTWITHVTVATTRPETMLGDTAVAMNPRDPRAKALVGKKVRLPIVGRIIPIIADDAVVLPDPESDDSPDRQADEKARFSTGFLKVTPAHDPTDWEIGQRHGLEVVNVLAPDGTISDRHGWDDATSPEARNLLGMDRFEAREAIVEWFRKENLLADVKEYVHEVGHSYRSHVPIEPYLSDQWFIAVKKQIPSLPDEGLIEGTDVPVNSLAGLALKPLLDGNLKFTPPRYAGVYRAWLENLRDWPISRQLWWGHQIPVWSQDLQLPPDVAPEPTDRGLDARTCAALDRAIGGHFGQRLGGFPGVRYRLVCAEHPDREGWVRTYICLDRDDPEAVGVIEKAGWRRDEDVLDTWFSSALWPISTMGWPEETELLKAFYPTDVLCTAREIITLWVSRMVMFGQYFRGQAPFRDVYIHAMIQDGQGRKMSKSLGNGIDPLDIIDSHGADALRFTLAYMTTQTQDVRMPVEKMTLPDGREANTSPKFDLGRNFCNKLWNAARFALMNLSGAPAWAEAGVGSHPADAWMLSRLHRTIRDVTEALAGYRFHDAATCLYRTMWNDFCDWYLEVTKVRLQAGDAAAKAVLAYVLDRLLRLLHPFVPFITEAVWERLNATVPHRGPGEGRAEHLLIRAAWPRAESRWIAPAVEGRFAVLQELISGIREVRSGHNVPPARRVRVTVSAEGDLGEYLRQCAELICALAGAEQVEFDSRASGSKTDATVLAGEVRALVHDVIDPEAEVARLRKRQQHLTRGLRGVEAKLANPRFLEKAPPQVVSRERERMTSLREELQAVEKALARLQ